MIFNSLGWWLIIILNFVGYLLLRFGMISRGASKDLIEVVGGLVLFISFILMFVFFGMKSGFILIPIFWIAVTPIGEIVVGFMKRKLYQ